jgi:hypothetical protein
MARPHRIIILTVLLIASACGSKREVEYAKKSVYDTDFASVYTAALAATREIYPTLNDSPGPGKISTAWHQVSYANNQDNLQNTRVLQQTQGMQPAAAPGQQQMAGVPTRLAYKRFFVRFDVSVVGGRPWRVKVVGKASEWDPGAAMPSEMTGAQRPGWLDARIDALHVAIYKRIKKHAIPMKEEVAASPDQGLPKTDPKLFQGVPPGAAKTLAAIKDALNKRDYAALRPQLDDDIEWSLGGGTGADVALAMWQADPGSFDSMNAAITAGCGAESDQRVVCPTGPPQRNVYQLVLEPRGTSWKVTSFVKGE